MPLRVLALASVAWLWLSACTPCSSSADCGAGRTCGSGTCRTTTVCSPGATAACTCARGADGTQTCNPLGTGLGDCNCATLACTPATCATVPSLVGKDLDAAGALLVAAKLRLPDPIDPQGFIVERRVADPPVSILQQSPAAGSLAPLGTAMSLVVTLPPEQQSLGSRADHFLVGDLVQDTPTSAQAYLDAIDPPTISSRTTLADWKTANGFGLPADAEASAIYSNHTDLGFGRHMHMRRAGKHVAFYVENYPSVEDAIAGRLLIATVAMEWSPREDGSAPADRFTKFFVFNRKGARITDPILDDFGPKQQPAVCLACHGGAISDPTYSNGGDLGARFIPFDLDSLAYSQRKNFTRADQEGAFKKFNEAVKATYPAADTSVVPELVDGWYGGPSHPSAVFDGTYTQLGWRSPAAAPALYQAVYARSCRSCHAQREPFRDFATYAQFIGKAPLVRSKMFEDGAMPLSERGYLNFWLSFPSQPKILAQAVGQVPFHGPGSPVARIALTNAGTLRPGQRITLDGSDSMFADTLTWTQAGGPAVTLVVSGALVAFTAPAAPATITIQLVAKAGTLGSPPVLLAVSTVDPPGPPTTVTAIAKIGGAQVSWNAPANTGNAALTGYRVIASPGTATANTGGGVTTALVEGLTPGASYTFTVIAQNAGGLSSVPSAPSNLISVPAVPAGSPTQPTNLVITPLAASARVAWSPPTNPGASAITSYTIKVSKAGAAFTTIANAVSPTTITSPALTTCNYQPGTVGSQACGSPSQYSFTVAATNTQGTGLTATASAIPLVSYAKDGVSRIWAEAPLPGGTRCVSCHGPGHAPDLSSPEPTPFNQARAHALPLDPGNTLYTYSTGTVSPGLPKMCSSQICILTNLAEAKTIQQWITDGTLP